MDIIVIGGGASGLVAAIVAARAGRKVTILEHKDRIGKKILATGNGKCNYTNLNQNPDYYRGEDPAYAFHVFQKFGVDDTIEFFKRLGIYPKEKNGCLYPYSEQAASVLDVLKMELDYLNVQIICNQHVERIEKKNNIFAVKTGDNIYEGQKVLMATGGMSASDLGSDGSGYKIAKMLGHTLIKPVPALVQLKAMGDYFKTVSGVRADAKIRLLINNQEAAESMGELQLTNYGVSGIPIFEISRFAAKALKEKKNVLLVIDFMRNLSERDVFLLLKERIEYCSYKSIENIFNGLLNKKLSYVLIKEAGISVRTEAARISDKEIKQLVTQIKQWQVFISDTNSFANAQVTAGGISTSEVDYHTMESKIVKGLYFMGELLDIDGTCGGYNLQWAWSTGYVAGLHSSID